MARHTHSHEPAGDAPVPGHVAGRSTLTHILVSLRPEQWTKNLVVFAGLLFGLKLGDPRAVAYAAAAAGIFCLLSGVVYLFNDILDREVDRRHPLKARRPIAAGNLSPRVAGVAAVVLGLGALAAAFALEPGFGGVALAYVVLQFAYSGPLKRMVIMDVLTIATGFVLRAVAGAVVIDVPIGHWLLVVTYLLALFLALSKRRHEIVLLADDAAQHRKILGEYSPYLLDQMIGVVTASTLIAYTFSSISPEIVEKFGTDRLGLTVPFVLYGIFRYLYLVHRREGGGNPSSMLLNDRPLLVCVALWALTVVIVLYRPFGV